MPTVPIYQTPQVSPSQLPSPFVQGLTPRELGEGNQGVQATENMGRALQGLGNELTREEVDAQNKANQVQHTDFVNFAKQSGMATITNFSQLQGKDAMVAQDDSGAPVNPIDTYAEKLKTVLDARIDTLGNDAQKLAARQTADGILSDFVINAGSHQSREYKRYQNGVNDTTIATATQQMQQFALQPDKTQEAIGGIRAAVAQKLEGMAPEQIALAQQGAVSTAHVKAIETLLDNQDTVNAQRYFKTWKDDLTPNAEAKVQKALTQADAGNAAISAVDGIWAAHGPADYNAPVDLFAMEKAVRDAFPTDATKRNAAMAEVRSRANAFEYSMRQNEAANVNAVMKNYDNGNGMSYAQLIQTPQFLQLPGDKQEQIKEHITSASRGNQRELEQQNYATYQDYLSDTDKLAQMSNDEIQALTPQIGNRLTTNLIQARNRLNTAAGKTSADIDKSDFDTNINLMGLDPATKSTSQKALIGMIHDRVNSLLTEAQAAKKAPLSRSERNDIMRQEMARTVTVPGGWFGSDKSLPVIQLTPDQASEIKVPDADRGQIVEALQAMYAKNPTNPAFAPTEQNVRALYLRKTSRAGSLIRGQ